MHPRLLVLVAVRRLFNRSDPIDGSRGSYGPSEQVRYAIRIRFIMRW